MNSVKLYEVFCLPNNRGQVSQNLDRGTWAEPRYHCGLMGPGSQLWVSGGTEDPSFRPFQLQYGRRKWFMILHLEFSKNDDLWPRTTSLAKIDPRDAFLLIQLYFGYAIHNSNVTLIKVVTFSLIVFVFFWDRVLLCSPGCPQTLDCLALASWYWELVYRALEFK
jgi:hypothetical protein